MKDKEPFFSLPNLSYLFPSTPPLVWIGWKRCCALCSGDLFGSDPQSVLGITAGLHAYKGAGAGRKLKAVTTRVAAPRFFSFPQNSVLTLLLFFWRQINMNDFRFPKHALLDIPSAHESLRGASRREWDRMAPIVFRMHNTTPSDLRALELLCDILATTKELEEEIAKDGVLIETGTGSRKANPALKNLESARKQAHVMLRDFGLTPGAKGNQRHANRVPESWLEDENEQA